MDYSFLELPQDLPQDLARQFEPNWFQFLFGLQNVPGPLGQGGFFAKASAFSAKLDGKADLMSYTFSTGDTEQGYFFPVLHLCVLADALLWKDKEGHWFDNYQPGCTSELRVYCLVREFGDYEPVVLKMGGYARSVGFDATRKDFANHIINPVSAAKKQSIPGYMFWMPVKAGPGQMVGNGDKKSRATPPTLALDLPIKDKKAVLADLYVGQELVSVITGALWAEAKKWKETQYKPAPQSAFDDLPPEMPAPEDDNDVPF